MIVPAERKPIPGTLISHSKLLLAEGNTPAHFFEAFCKHLGIDKTIEIRNYGGINDLPAFLRTLVAGPDFKSNVQSLVVARDAEDDAGKSKKSVETLIGTLKLGPSVKTQVLILPTEINQGMIETLCLSSVVDKPHYQCINEFVACVESKGVQLPAGYRRDKHLAQLYLATHDEPQMFPGIAAYQHVWPFDHPAFDRVKSLLLSI